MDIRAISYVQVLAVGLCTAYNIIYLLENTRRGNSLAVHYIPPGEY